MDDRSGRLSDEMLLALAVWLCSLPLVAALVIPWLGWPGAVSVAVMLLLVTLMACWGACGWRAFVRSSRRQDKHDLG
jgi:hypothetical protein